jgi:alkylation response protein AidB-like acyl-CoA dehydrogenase
MDLELAPEDRAYRDGLRRWLRANLPRRTPGRRRGEALDAERVEALKAWQRKLLRAGYLALGWPREHGGQGASLLRQTLVGEELARQRAPGLIGQMGLQMVGPTLIRWGSAAQQRRFLPKILSAEEIWCQGYSEPGAGSDLASLKTSALRAGDAWVVKGHKIWTTNAQIADWMFCLVRTDPAAPKHRGISYLLIDMRSPGISVRPLVQMTGDAGFNEVFLDDVRVPLENTVGEPDQGWQVANTTLHHERNMLGSTTQTQRLFEALVRLAAGARGRAGPRVRPRLAQLKIEVEALRFLAYRNLSAALAGRPPGVEASITKLATTELNHRIAETALGLLGPQGCLRDGDWAYELLWSLGMIIGGGTSQIQRNLIATRGLGLPRGA